MTKKLIPCQFCKVPVKKSRLENHSKKVHQQKKFEQPSINKRLREVNQLFQKMRLAIRRNGALKRTSTKKRRQQTQIDSLLLFSRRGARVFEEKTCDECYSHKATWKYAKSNKGTVFLCDSCKGRVLEKSFHSKGIDVLDLTLCSGSFETNRQKH